jgi:hypothetical protein
VRALCGLLIAAFACGAPEDTPDVSEAPPTQAPASAADAESIEGAGSARSEAESEPALPLERLLTLPEPVVSELQEPDLVLGSPAGPESPANGQPEDGMIEPSVRVESERIETVVPGKGADTRSVQGGVTLSPGSAPGSSGGASPKITIEGGVREEVRDDARDDPKRQPTAGVRIEIPWPGEKDD